MYIKKWVLVVCAVVLIIATAMVSVGVINPFGFGAWEELVHFSDISKTIREEYYKDVTPEIYEKTALKGVAAATKDPYTMYYWGEEADAYMENIEGNYQGVGLYVENNTKDDTITVVSAIAGTPAEKAGLVTGDIITAVNGESYRGSQLDEAVEKMRGEEGSEVTLSILKKDTGKTEDVKLLRQKIVLQSVEGKMLTDQVAMARITQFTEDTAESFANCCNELSQKGMKKLIIDLRNNPGGIMEQAVAIADMFLPAGKVIVYTMDKHGEREDYISEGEGIKMPIVILTNGGSASASEILTGALKDHELAYQIGEKTYGKGIVQGVFNLSESEILSITIAQYYTPNGSCIHKKGIEPDEEIKLDEEAYQNLSEKPDSEDPQLQAAIRYLSK